MRCLTMLLIAAAAVSAQDPFEIHVYEYEPMPLGSFTYEAHVNYVAAKGTNTFAGAAAPPDRQLHFTSELTFGFGDTFALGTMLLTSASPGRRPEYAGWRIVPHVFAPRSWKLPVNVGLLAEFSFEHPAYEESTKNLELHLVVEKHIGRLQMDGNPAFARGLNGEDRRWEFEPSGRVGWQASKSFTPSIEYYGFWGPVGDLSRLHEQVHEIVPGGDLKVSERLLWNFGVGAGFGDRAAGALVKMRFEWSFGR